MYKWLRIMGIVSLGFIIVLLSLGYALKENKEVTTALKHKLDQQKLASSPQQSPTAKLMFVDNKKDDMERLARLKKIIVKNVTCVDSRQCVLIDIKEPTLNCIVSVNTIGASLLMKELKGEYMGKTRPKNSCDHINKNLTNVCVQNLCQIKAE